MKNTSSGDLEVGKVGEITRLVAGFWSESRRCDSGSGRKMALDIEVAGPVMGLRKIAHGGARRQRVRHFHHDVPSEH